MSTGREVVALQLFYFEHCYEAINNIRFLKKNSKNQAFQAVNLKWYLSVMLETFSDFMI